MHSVTFLQRILVFGGSFNPPTLAHETIMRTCLELPQFDAVWVMPSGSRLDKTIGTPDNERLRMLQMVKRDVFDDDPRLHISDFELRLPRPSQTWRTIAELQKAYPETEFWFAFGGDAYRDMHNWPRADSYMHQMRMVVFTDYPVPETTTGRVLRLSLPSRFQDMSSHAVRRLLAQGVEPKGMLSEPIKRYIAHSGLYK